jgi:hypothetical protein
MRRSLLLLALLYGYGDARFDNYRPELLDRTLRSFHRTVELAASDGRRAIADGRRAVAVLNDARTMQYLAAGLRQLNNGF